MAAQYPRQLLKLQPHLWQDQKYSFWQDQKGTFFPHFWRQIKNCLHLPQQRHYGKFMKPLQRKHVIGGHFQYIQSNDVLFIIFRLTWANHGAKEEFHVVL